MCFNLGFFLCLMCFDLFSLRERRRSALFQISFNFRKKEGLVLNLEDNIFPQCTESRDTCSMCADRPLYHTTRAVRMQTAPYITRHV